MEKEITIFRVRPSFEDIKGQKGAFVIFECAVKCAKRYKCNVYDNDGNCLFSGK